MTVITDEKPEPTPRELEVLKLVAKGLSAKEIAVELGISPRTVEVHKFNITLRFKARSIVQAVAEARKRGILD